MDTLAKICININVNTLAQSHNAIVKFNLAKKVTSYTFGIQLMIRFSKT